jgi:hypothetical protein
MRDTIASVLMIALIFVGVPVLILLVRVRMRRAGRESPKTHARLLQPDWACVERHLRRRVPRALRDVYADHTLVTARDLPYSTDHSIGSFEPLDEQAMADATGWLGFEAVAFATTDAGDMIYLRPGVSEADIVYLTRHDGGDTEILAAKLEELLDTLRLSKPGP